ncbi:MAG: hypothetical protein JWO09_2723 [Bacteroidetes bacterium]|nr:hypothetical protein [Bacteroidota bacterium]
MKTIWLIAALGLVSGAIYAKGGFTKLKNTLNPVKVKSLSKNKSVKGTQHTTGAEHTKSSISQSYAYPSADREY